MTPDTTRIATDLLRSPASIARSIAEGRSLRAIARVSTLAIFAGTLGYGAVVGSHRGGLQILYAAAKLPLVSILTLALAAPVLHGASAALDRPIPFAKATSLVLAASARTALVLLALAPAVALALAIVRDYHVVSLLAALGFGLAGLAGLGLLHRGLGEGEGRFALTSVVLVAYLLTSAQAAWGLRPWVVRPSAQVVLVRPPEGTVAQELARAGFSAAGYYDEARARERAAERMHRGSSR